MAKQSNKPVNTTQAAARVAHSIAGAAPIAPPVVLSTFGNMAATLTAEPLAAKAAKVITPEQMAAGVTVGTTANVYAAKHVVAKQLAGTMGAVPAAIAACSYILGRPCRVRVPHTITAFAACAKLLAAGAATGAALVVASDASFVPYAIKNQWLIAA